MTGIVAGLIGGVAVIAAVLIVVQSAVFAFIDAAAVIGTVFND